VQAVLDIRLAVFSFLVGVGFLGKFKGELDHGGVGFGVILLKLANDLVYGHGRLLL